MDDNNGKNASNFMTNLKAIKMIDTEAGLSYCMSDEDFYKDVIGDYLESDKLDNLNRFFNESQWDDYRVLIHALKSSSLTIGATDLSEKAKALEAACKASDVDYIINNHAQVMEEYKQILSDLNNAI